MSEHREYTALRSFRQWESTFMRHRGAPPKGWKRYLRDGWSQGIDHWRARYRLYLLSSAWSQRRDGAIRRSGGLCEVCQQSTAKPHVHHVNYMRAGSEHVEDLRVLCRSCHGVVHTMKRAPNIPLNEQATAHVMAREYRQRAREYRQKAAALAAGDVTPDTFERPRVRRRPKPETIPDT